MSSITKWEDWHARAACIGEMGAMFYPPMRPEKRSVKNALQSATDSRLSMARNISASKRWRERVARRKTAPPVSPPERLKTP